MKLSKLQKQLVWKKKMEFRRTKRTRKEFLLRFAITWNRNFLIVDEYGIRIKERNPKKHFLCGELYPTNINELNQILKHF